MRAAVPFPIGQRESPHEGEWPSEEDWAIVEPLDESSAMLVDAIRQGFARGRALVQRR